MALFMLEYDLRKQRNYEPLYDQIKDFKAVRILKSLWAFERYNTNSEKLRDHFRNLVDADDGLIVMEISAWATVNTLGTPKELTT